MSKNKAAYGKERSNWKKKKIPDTGANLGLSRLCHPLVGLTVQEAKLIRGAVQAPCRELRVPGPEREAVKFRDAVLV